MATVPSHQQLHPNCYNLQNKYFGILVAFVYGGGSTAALSVSDARIAPN